MIWTPDLYIYNLKSINIRSPCKINQFEGKGIIYIWLFDTQSHLKNPCGKNYVYQRGSEKNLSSECEAKLNKIVLPRYICIIKMQYIRITKIKYICITREVLKKTSHLSVRQNGSHVDLSYNLEAEIEVICIPGGLHLFVNIFCRHIFSSIFLETSFNHLHSRIWPVPLQQTHLPCKCKF